MKKSRLLPLLCACILLACAPPVPARPTATESFTAIPPTAAALTDTPLPSETPLPSDTPPPPATSTPAYDWEKDFAEPILQAIAGAPPAYEDIFSDPASGWYVGATSGDAPPKIDGERRYDRGEYRIAASPATADFPTVCSGGEDRNVGFFTDFVAEFAVKFISGAEGNWQLQFRRNVGLYQALLDRRGNLGFEKCGFGLDECVELAKTTGSHIRLGVDWNVYKLIVRGGRMAIYVNDIPTLYAEDPLHIAENTGGYFSLNVCNTGPDPLDTKWDNFRVWDISALP